MQDYLDFARRGRTAWWAYLATAVLALGAWIVVDIAIVSALLISHVVSGESVGALFTPAHPAAFLLGNGVTFVTLLAALILAMRLVQAKRFVDVIGRWRWTLFGTGVALWTVCLVVGSVADVLLRPAGFKWSASGETAILAVVAAFALGAQTFTEEFVFRGWLTQGLLLATKRPLPAAILSGLMFGALHIPNGVPQCVNAVLVGIIYSLIAIRTGGIAFTWGLHLANNLFGAVVVVSVADVFKGSPGLITQSTPELLWFDVIAGVALLAIPAWYVLRHSPSSPPAEVA